MKIAKSQQNATKDQINLKYECVSFFIALFFHFAHEIKNEGFVQLFFFERQTEYIAHIGEVDKKFIKADIQRTRRTVFETIKL